MERLIFIFIPLILICSLISDANAKDEIWMQIGAVSKHSKSTHSVTGLKYNENHTGLGVEYHLKKYQFAIGSVKNSFNRNMQYFVFNRYWEKHFSKNLSGSVQIGAGLYKYEGYITEIVMDISTGKEIERINHPIEKIGIAPWLSISSQYKRIGFNIGYIPKNVIGEKTDSAITLQFKLKLK